MVQEFAWRLQGFELFKSHLEQYEKNCRPLATLLTGFIWGTQGIRCIYIYFFTSLFPFYCGKKIHKWGLDGWRGESGPLLVQITSTILSLCSKDNAILWRLNFTQLIVWERMNRLGKKWERTGWPFLTWAFCCLQKMSKNYLHCRDCFSCCPLL